MRESCGCNPWGDPWDRSKEEEEDNEADEKAWSVSMG
jgi:hypothetical protein